MATPRKVVLSCYPTGYYEENSEDIKCLTCYDSHECHRQSCPDLPPIIIVSTPAVDNEPFKELWGRGGRPK